MPTLPPDRFPDKKPVPTVNRDIVGGVEIDRNGSMDGVTVMFKPIGYGDGGAVFNIVWDSEAGFDNDNTQTGEEGNDLKWIEIETAGVRETAGLMKALIELGERLKPLLEQLERREPI